MRKRKEVKRNRRKNRVLSPAIYNKNDLSDTIVSAYYAIEKNKKDKQIEEENKHQEEWETITGQKKIPEGAGKFEKWKYSIRNDLFGILKILFIKRENVQDMRATVVLMKMSINLVYKLVKWAFYILAMAYTYNLVVNRVQIVYSIVGAGCSWIIARIFRIASFETDKIRDWNLLVSIFSGVLSFVAVVVAIVTIMLS